MILSVIAKFGTIQLVYALERIGGAVAGALQYLLFFSLISFLIGLLAMPTVNTWYQESLSGKAILDTCSNLHNYSVAVLKAIFSGLTVKQV